MGIVTWITLRTEIMPTVQETFLVGTGKLDDLLDYIYSVQRRFLGEQLFVLNRTAAALLNSVGIFKPSRTCVTHCQASFAFKT